MFIFPMLILYKVIEVSIFQTIIYVFEILISLRNRRLEIMYLLRHHSIYTSHEI